MIEIHGERVFLRSMTRDEFHQVRRDYVPDPIMDPGPYQYDEKTVDEKYDASLARAAWYPIAGVFTADGQIIGEVSFKRIDQAKSRCELGIALSRDAHKEKGYGTEAFRLALDYAMDTLGLDNVYADTMGSNLRMQKILEKLGFRCYLRMQDCYDMGDRWEDRLDYVITREERQPPA